MYKLSASGIVFGMVRPWSFISINAICRNYKEPGRSGILAYLDATGMSLLSKPQA